MICKELGQSGRLERLTARHKPRRHAAERRRRARVMVQAMHCDALDFSLEILADIGDDKCLFPHASNSVH